MQSILSINWDTVDWKREFADYLEMPDGSQRLVEMQLFYWYWIQFIVKELDSPLSDIISDVLGDEVLSDDEFTEALKIYLIEFGDGYLETTEGLPRPPRWWNEKAG